MEPQVMGQWAIVEDRLVWVWTTMETNAKQKVVELLQPSPKRANAA
jgi:hypothetical protein